MAILRDFTGLKAGERFTVDAHEKIARAFEAYMREGSAPTEGLARVFARTRDWRLPVYGSVKDLDVALTGAEFSRAVRSRVRCPRPV